MDLEEFLFNEQKKNRSFTTKKFAELLEVTPSYLNRLKRGVVPLSSQLIYEIDKISEGKVDVLGMLREYYSKKDSRR